MLSVRLKNLSLAGIIGAVLHLAILAHTVWLILSTSDPKWTGYWMLFLALDFPLSLGSMPVTWLVPPSPAGPLADASNFWWPALYHGLVGTAWWYIVAEKGVRNLLLSYSGRGKGS